MKTRSQLIAIFFASIILIIGTAFILRAVISSKNKVLLEQGYNDLQKETDKTVTFNSTAFKNWVYDNSYWDELTVAYKKQDSNWAHENIGLNMEKFGSDYLWLLNKDGSKFYTSFTDKNEDANGHFFTNNTSLIDSLKRSPFRHFYVSYNNLPVEIFTAPVQPSADTGRTSPAQGYFITGRRLDNQYLKELSFLSEKSDYSLLPASASAGDKIIEAGSVANYNIEFHDLSGKPIQLLKVTKKFEVLALYKKDLSRYLVIFIIILAVIFALLYFFFRAKVIHPLYLLSESLEKKNDAILSKMKLRSDEYGQVALLITDFFNHNDILQEEIEYRRNSEKALQKAALELEKTTIEKIRAEQAHLAKSEFLSTMSHEIRTPINGVIGIANLLMDEPLSEKQKEYVDILNFSSRHLLSIVSDILDFSKIESGNMQFDKSSFNLKNTCYSVYNLFEPKANEKHIEFVFEPDENISYSLYGDHVRLCQVLTNLLSNAIKFTETGKVSFGYKFLSESTSHINLEFSVKDTGIGISRENFTKIFESFSQVDASISSQYGGTGLGLTISKRLVELQGGKFSVESKHGEGSVFTFYLSFEKHVYVDSLPNPVNAAAPVKNLQGMKVLVVEDNNINALVINRFLDKWSVLMTRANNGKEAINELCENNYDLILMDLQMPVMDGKQATRIIRNEKGSGYNTIPIIALTADATADTQNKILQLGFDQYLSKPFNPDALYRLLKKYYEKN
jgi:signal transduction histidine kinase/ActR/RegA family two-component response regulator